MSTLSLARSFSLFAFLLLSVGCSTNKYDVEMSFDDTGFQRRLTGWHEQNSDDGPSASSLHETDVERLRLAYGSEGSSDDQGRNLFEGHFDDVIPNDVGGFGTVTRWENSLGTLSLYRERVRGADNLAARWEENVQKIDRLCELLGEWAIDSAVDAAEGRAVSQFVNGPFRDDLRDLAMHYWMYSRSRPAFFSADQIPDLARLEQQQDPEAKLAGVLAFIDHKRGETARPLAEVIPALASIDTLNASWHRFFANTPEAAEAREQSSEPENLNYNEIPSAMMWEITLLNAFLRGGDELTIRFHASCAPYETNGTWDKDDQQVTWHHAIEGYDGSPFCVLPAFCYASWAEPDDEVQIAHFGRVVFVDRQLANYILWFESLDETRAAAWSAFIADLTPDDPLERAFQQFRFQGEPTHSETSLVSDIPRAILETVLNEVH